MNRGLFCTLVLVFCMLIVVTITSCENRSGRRAVTTNGTVVSNQVTVKIVILKRTNSESVVTGQFKVKKTLDSTVYFWSTSLPYEVGDTVNVPLTSLKQ